MDPISQYIEKSKQIIDTVENQKEEIKKASKWFSDTIRHGRMVHLFGSGHSRIMVEEMWPRYGSFPGFNPIVELSLSFHNLVVGANGQRQAMFLENVSGLADRILRNFDLSEKDSALVISSSGTSQVSVEMAELFQRKGIKVVAIVTKSSVAVSQSKRQDGKKLDNFADLVLDTGAPKGDAMVEIQNLETPVSPGSTVGGALLVNCIKAEVAKQLTESGHPPKVLSSGSIVGKEKSKELFESAYDEHAHRLAKLYENVGSGSNF